MNRFTKFLLSIPFVFVWFWVTVVVLTFLFIPHLVVKANGVKFSLLDAAVDALDGLFGLFEEL